VSAGVQKVLIQRAVPKTAPEGAHFSPVLHAVTGIVVTDDVFICVLTLRRDRLRFHVNASFLKALHCLLSLLVRIVNGYTQLRSVIAISGFFRRTNINSIGCSVNSERSRVVIANK